MSFKVTDIHLLNFRSYEALDLSGLGDLTIFVGPNAAGKSNIIEAIQLLTALSSFRNATSAELIKKSKHDLIEIRDVATNELITEHDSISDPIKDLMNSFENTSDFAKITIKTTDGNRILELVLLIDENKRQYILNGKKKQPKELKGIVPAVTFTPDDLELAKGGHSHRRREIDLLGSQLNSNYAQIVRDFDKVLRYKNKLLKDDVPKSYIDAMNTTFTKVSAKLSEYRASLLNKLMPYVNKLYSDIVCSDESLSSQYIESWVKDSQAESLEDWVESNTDEEIRRKQTLVGAHRDEIIFQIDGLSVSDFASQGQQRSVVLSIKLAEADLIEDMLGTQPILLLDDVMSELDADRRHALVNSLLKDRQTFITTANLDYFDEETIKHANIINIEKSR